MEAAIGFEVGKFARSDVEEKPLMMQLLWQTAFLIDFTDLRT